MASTARAFVGTLLTLAAFHAAANAADAPRLGVVDLPRVFQGYEKMKGLRTWREKALHPLRTKAAALKDEIAGFQEILKTQKLDAAEVEDLEKRVTQRTRAIEDLERQGRRAVDREGEQLKEVYRAVNEAVSKYATEHGLDVVLGQGSPPPFPFATRPNPILADQENTPVLLFVRPQADITDAIIDRLNAEYREAAAK